MERVERMSEYQQSSIVYLCASACVEGNAKKATKKSSTRIPLLPSHLLTSIRTNVQRRSATTKVKKMNRLKWKQRNAKLIFRLFVYSFAGCNSDHSFSNDFSGYVCGRNAAQISILDGIKWNHYPRLWSKHGHLPTGNLFFSFLFSRFFPSKRYMSDFARH